MASASSIVDAQELNIYNWSDNIADDTVSGFVKQTGTHTRYDVYDSDETLQAKLLAALGLRHRRTVVDLCRQTDSGRRVSEARQEQDPEPGESRSGADETRGGADPGNQYTVPWSWNRRPWIQRNAGHGDSRQGRAGRQLGSVVRSQIRVQLKRCGVSVLDSPEDAFAAGLVYLHKDQNSRNPADYQAVYDLYRTIRPYITQFNSSGYINDLANNDICLALAWSGDVAIAKKRASEAHKSYVIDYSIPKGDGILWFDLMAVPKDAPHAASAMQWINYILQPNVSAAITNQVFYPNANKGRAAAGQDRYSRQRGDLSEFRAP